MGRHDRRKLGLSPFETLWLRRRPILYVSRNGTSNERNVQKFFVTPTAIENLLRFHSNAFARVDTLRSEHKERYISVAHRRRIGTLVVVAGSTGSGHVELAQELAAGGRPELTALMGGSAGGGWRLVDADRMTDVREPAVERMILHYDLLRPHRRSAKTHARDEVMDVLRCAQRLAFVTLWRPPASLRRRFQEHAVPLRTRAGLAFEGRRRRKILRELADPAEILGHYRRWLAFTKTQPGPHVVVSPEGEPRLSELAAWERAQPPDAGDA
jgi:hypothetical protein